ncbi:MAG: hypothetical protein OJF49_001030 [Ktedonobacterales bacterium]|nr:MAG: hypothetical protein OJF49_001030 [Ktedonobacterales bacterium]
MTTYQCQFCGVTYHRPSVMRSCTICGHTTASGWLRELHHEHPTRQPEARRTASTKQAA